MVISTPETFLSLLHDSAHWEFELFLMALFDGLLLGILWPWLRTHVGHHLERDRREAAPPLSKETKRVLCRSQYGGIYSLGKMN